MIDLVIIRHEGTDTAPYIFRAPEHTGLREGDLVEVETTRRNSMIESYWRQIKALQGMPAVKVTDNEPVQPVQS